MKAQSQTNYFSNYLSRKNSIMQGKEGKLNQLEELEINKKLNNIEIKDEQETKQITLGNDDKVYSDVIPPVFTCPLRKDTAGSLRSKTLVIKGSKKNDLIQNDLDSQNLKNTSSLFQKNNLKKTLKSTVSKMFNINKSMYDEFDVSEMIKEFEKENKEKKLKLSAPKLVNDFSSNNSDAEDSYVIKDVHSSSVIFINDDSKNELSEAEQIKDAELKALIEKENYNKNNSKKKKKIKDMFSMVISNDTKKEKKPSGMMEKLLTSSNIFSKNNFDESKNEKYFKNTSDQSVAVNQNQYNAMMIKYDEDETKFEEKNSSLNQSKLNINDSLMGIERSLSDKDRLKPELVDEMKKYLFQIGIDETSDEYCFEPLIFKDERYVNKYMSNSSSSVNFQSSNDLKMTFGKSSRAPNQMVKENFKHSLFQDNNQNKIKKESEADLIESEIEYHTIDDEKNYYRYRKKTDNKISEYFEKLIENHIETSHVISTLRKINQEVNKIEISFGKWADDKGVYLRLFKNKSLVCENFIFFDKIKLFFQKTCIYNILPIYGDLYNINSLEMFLEKVLIYLCFPIYSEDSKTFSIAVLRKPVGVFSHKSYEFTFLESPCSIDFIVIEARVINMLIFSINDNKSIQISFDLDEACFSLLFDEIKDQSTEIYKEKLIPSYYFKNYDYMGKNGFIPKMIIRVHEILKGKMQGKKLYKYNFNTFLESFPEIVLKIQIKNELKNIDLWMITYENNFKWLVDFYTLEKVEISNKLLYIHKTFYLGQHDFINITGVDPKNISDLLTDREIIIINYLLLNSVKFKNINTKILTEKNYDAIIKLTRIIPINIYLEYNKNYYVISFEFLAYSVTNYFIKIIITETQSCRTYSKLFLPEYMHCYKNDLEELKKELENRYKLNKKLVDNYSFKQKLKSLLQHWASNILQKNTKYYQFENITTIIDKLI